MHDTATKALVSMQGCRAKEQVGDPSSPYKHNSVGVQASEVPAFLASFRAFWPTKHEESYAAITLVRLLHYEGSVQRKASPLLR